MQRYLARRAAAAAGLLLVTSFVLFLLEHLAPGNAESVLLGGRPSTPALIASIRHQYHLDASLPEQYWIWLSGVLQFNLGDSITYKTPVSSVVGSRVMPTLELAIYAATITVVVGVALGAAAALRQGRLADSAISGVVLVLASISSYVSGVVLLVVFGVKLGWFPIIGTGTGGTDRLLHLTLTRLPWPSASSR